MVQIHNKKVGVQGSCLVHTRHSRENGNLYQKRKGKSKLSRLHTRLLFIVPNNHSRTWFHPKARIERF